MWFQQVSFLTLEAYKVFYLFTSQMRYIFEEFNSLYMYRVFLFCEVYEQSHLRLLETIQHWWQLGHDLSIWFLKSYGY